HWTDTFSVLGRIRGLLGVAFRAGRSIGSWTFRRLLPLAALSGEAAKIMKHWTDTFSVLTPFQF
ncbi:MAG: hypothetical protein ACI9JZ_002416, partial [Lentimonas sp.]